MATRNDTQPGFTLIAKPGILSSLMSDLAYLGRALSHGLAGLAEQRVRATTTYTARHYGEDLSARMVQQPKGRPAEQNPVPRAAVRGTANTPAISNIRG